MRSFNSGQLQACCCDLIAQRSSSHGTVHNFHTLHACTASPVPTHQLLVFRHGTARLCHKTVTCRKTVHRVRCQRRWVGPPAHGAVANHSGPRNWDPPSQGGRKEGRGRVYRHHWYPPPKHQGDHTPADSPFPRRVPHVPPPSLKAGGRDKMVVYVPVSSGDHEHHAVRCDQCVHNVLADTRSTNDHQYDVRLRLFRKE